MYFSRQFSQVAEPGSFRLICKLTDHVGYCAAYSKQSFHLNFFGVEITQRNLYHIHIMFAFSLVGAVKLWSVQENAHDQLNMEFVPEVRTCLLQTMWKTLGWYFNVGGGCARDKTEITYSAVVSNNPINSFAPNPTSIPQYFTIHRCARFQYQEWISNYMKQQLTTWSGVVGGHRYKEGASVWVKQSDNL